MASNKYCTGTYYVESIVGRREVVVQSPKKSNNKRKRGGKQSNKRGEDNDKSVVQSTTVQYWIKWLHYDINENTWETADVLIDAGLRHRQRDYDERYQKFKEKYVSPLSWDLETLNDHFKSDEIEEMKKHLGKYKYAAPYVTLKPGQCKQDTPSHVEAIDGHRFSFANGKQLQLQFLVTWLKIKKRYPIEWICAERFVTTKSMEMLKEYVKERGLRKTENMITFIKDELDRCKRPPQAKSQTQMILEEISRSPKKPQASGSSPSKQPAPQSQEAKESTAPSIENDNEDSVQILSLPSTPSTTQGIADSSKRRRTVEPRNICSEKMEDPAAQDSCDSNGLYSGPVFAEFFIMRKPLTTNHVQNLTNV